MRCPDCDYELREEWRVCPRCEYRRAAPAATAAAPPPVSETPADVTAPLAPPAARRPAPPAKWGAVLVAVLALVGAGTGFLRLHRMQRVAASPQAAMQREREDQVRSLFSGAEGPCRHNDTAPCQVAVNKIRALDDQPDASLLLADVRIADYLRKLPGGGELSVRWQRDQIAQDELAAMAEVAHRRNLSVYRSLWISADIKRYDVAIPELVFGDAK